MSTDHAGWVFRTLAVGLCGLTAAVSLLSALDGLRTLPVRAAALAPDRLPLQDLSRLVDDPLGADPCADGAIADRLALATAYLDRLGPGTDGDVRAAADSRARRTAAAAVLCSPGEGTGWAWLAVLDRSDPAEAVRALVVSQRFAPTNPRAIRVRMRAYAAAADPLPPAVAKALRADLETMLRNWSEADAAPLVAALPAAAAPQIAAAGAAVPPERRPPSRPGP